MKSYWKKRLTAIALVCLMVLMMVPETALSVYAADEDEILVGAEEIVEQDAEEAVELPEISEVYPETLEGSEEEFVEEDAEEVIIEDAPVILEEEAEPEIQSEVPEIIDAEIEVADPEAVDGIEAAEAEELTGAAATSATVVVKKEWADGAENHQNDTVTAEIWRGNTRVQTVTLSSSNGWRAEVTGLNASYTYTVRETLINSQSITGKYEATVQSSSRTEYVWAKKNYGNLTSGDIYAFTYTSNGTTYVFGANNSDDLIGSTDGLNSDGSPNSSISDNFMWDVSGSWRLHNKGRNKYLYIEHLIGGGGAGLQSSSSSVKLNSSGEIYIDGLFNVDTQLLANGSSIGTAFSSGSGSKFTPYLLTGIITVNEFTINNTKINNYKLVYDANGGTGAPTAQQSEPTTATSQAFTVSTTAPSRGDDYTFEGWATTSDATTANVGSTVTVTTSDPLVDGVYTKTIYAVWKAREKFYVYHTGAAGGNLETIYKDTLTGGKYDLTQNLTTDTLYGGYYLENGLTKPADGAAYDGSNWTFTNAETVLGTAITPVAGTTYYVKEVPITYLKPVTYILYDTTDKVEGASNCKGRLQRLFAMAAVDDEQYQSIGFDIGGVSGVTGYDKQSAYTEFVVTRGGQTYKTYTTSSLFGVQGKLAVANMSNLLQENLSYTMTPYWVTRDGIKVTSVYQYAQSIGNCYHYGWASPGITKAMTKPGSTLTPQTRTLNTRKLSVSRYLFNDDEPNPTEPVTPPETVEPTTEPTETVEPEPTTEPTETVETEPTAEPTEEPTTAPEEETVEPTPTETPVPTTAPTTTPTSSAKDNTTPSSVIGKLLKYLGSLFR